MKRRASKARLFGAGSVWTDQGGVAAAEMALWLSAMVLPVLNVVDLGFYLYQRMQVETAAEAAVNAAWHDCNSTAATPAPPPLLTNCKAAVSGVFSDMVAAAQSTSLGTNVTLPLANIVEGYYCATSLGALNASPLTAIGTAANPPSTAPAAPNCSGSTTLAGDYVQATTTYTYKPLFANVSILSLLGTNVSKTAWLRLDK